MEEFYIFEYLVNSDKRTYWFYILSSILIALIWLYFNKKELKINLSSKLWLHPSAKLDYYYFIFSYFIKVFMIIPIIISAKTVASFIYKYLYLNYGYMEISLSYETVILLYTFTLFLVSDFTRYWLHRLMHTIPFLWEFHKVHHSAKVLNPLSFYRVHPIENILFGLRYSIAIGLTTGVFLYFFGAKITIIEVIGANVFVFVFSTLGANLRHSHIKLAYPRFCEYIFISPKQHQIHHSKKFFHKNYGGYLAIWDFIFKSHKLSNEVKSLKFGLKKEQMKNYSSINKLLFFPFKNLVRR